MQSVKQTNSNLLALIAHYYYYYSYVIMPVTQRTVSKTNMNILWYSLQVWLLSLKLQMKLCSSLGLILSCRYYTKVHLCIYVELAINPIICKSCLYQMVIFQNPPAPVGSAMMVVPDLLNS